MIGNKKHYLLAGASGLIGGHLLQSLLDDPETAKVTSLVRTPSGKTHQKLQEKTVDWDTFTEKDLPINLDATFCCLGTTMKKARTKEAFKKVDFDYVLKLAVFSQRLKVPQFHVVSARGANPKAIIYYNRVKGNMQLELEKLTKLRSIYIYQPSMLLGEREEFRLGETLGKIFMRAIDFMTPKSSKAIYGSQVAESMLQHAKNGKKGLQYVSNEEMHATTA